MQNTIQVLTEMKNLINRYKISDKQGGTDGLTFLFRSHKATVGYWIVFIELFSSH